MVRWLSYPTTVKYTGFTALSTAKNLTGVHLAKQHVKSLQAKYLTHRTNPPQLLTTGFCHLYLLELKLIDELKAAQKAAISLVFLKVETLP